MSRSSQPRLRRSLIAAARYFLANAFSADAARDFDFGFLARIAHRGDLRWPQRTGPWTRGSDVLDIGCGRNFQGYGFLATGARSYTGLDPTLDLDDDRVKDSREKWSTFERGELSPRALMARFPRLRYTTATIEEFQPETKFGAIVMHNVTEHLMDIAPVFARLSTFLRAGGRIVVRHPNYYCWHGHHMKPRTVDEYDPADAPQQFVADWAHVRFDPVKHAWIGRTQNRIRLYDLRALIERHFAVEVWEEAESEVRQGLHRLTPEILRSFPEFTRSELATKAVFIVGRAR